MKRGGKAGVCRCECNAAGTATYIVLTKIPIKPHEGQELVPFLWLFYNFLNIINLLAFFSCGVLCVGF